MLRIPVRVKVNRRRWFFRQKGCNIGLRQESHRLRAFFISQPKDTRQGKSVVVRSRLRSSSDQFFERFRCEPKEAET